MSPPCPVSWLTLERYHLGEASGPERAFVEARLADCEHCAAMMARVRGDHRPLPPLPAAEVAAARRQASRRWRLAWFAPALAAAAALLSLPGPSEPPPDARRWKGGELAISLVRERGGLEGAETYLDGDRFLVRLTCPPGPTGWEVAVYQGGEAAFPLDSGAPLACGNHVPLGAFAITGPGDALVCAVLGEGRPGREALAAAGPEALGEGAVCAPLTEGRSR
jgi:hypothetical protein